MPEASSLQKLVVQIEADIRDLKKGLSVASSDIGAFTRKADAQTKQVKASFSSFASSFIGPLGIPVSIGAATVAMGAFVRSSVDAADAVGDASAAVGLSAKSFQELRSAMSYSDISAQEFEGGMTKLLQVTGDAIAGNKAAAKSFDTLGVSLRDTNGDVKSQDQVLDEVIAKLGTYGTEQDRAALAADLFGRSVGPKLASFASQGTDAIEELRSAAATFSDEQIRLAAEVNDKWEKLTTAIGVEFKSALLEALEATGKFVSAFSLAEVNNEIAKTMAELEELRAVKERRGPAESDLEDHLIKEKEARLAELQAEQRKRLGDQHKNSPESRNAAAEAAAQRRKQEQAEEEAARNSKKREDEIARARDRAKKASYDAEYDELMKQYKREEELREKGLEEERVAKDAELDAIQERAKAAEAAWTESYQNIGESLRGMVQDGKVTSDELKGVLIQAAFQVVEAWLKTRAVMGAGAGAPGGASMPGAGGGGFGGMIGGAFGTAVGGPLGGAIGAGLGSLFGFANGGAMTVGGSGGTDSQVVSFRATPGEVVAVGKPGAAASGGSSSVSVPVTIINNSSAQVSTKPNSRGGLDVMIEQAVAKSIERNGSVGRAVSKQTGSKRPPLEGRL